MAAFYDHNPLLSISFATQFVLNNQSSNSSGQSINQVSPGTLNTAAQAVLTAIIVLACLAVIGACLWSNRTKKVDDSDVSVYQGDDSSIDQYQNGHYDNQSEYQNGHYEDQSEDLYQSNGQSVVMGVDSTSLIQEAHRTKKSRKLKLIV